MTRAQRLPLPVRPLVFDVLVRLEGPLRAWDTQPMVTAAVRHGLSGMALAQLQKHPSLKRGFTPEQLSVLAQESRAVAQQALRSHALLLRCLDAFAAAGLSPVVLKGPVLAARLWPEPLLRPSGDVDLLVRPEELEQSREVLLGMGLRLQPGTHEEAAEDEHHVVYVSDSGGMVELHHRPLAGMGAALEWHHLRPPVEVAWEGRTVRVLAPEDEFVYLAAHAANHLFLRASWLYELYLFKKAHPDMNWDRVVGLAKEAKLSTPVWAAMDAAALAFGLGLSLAVTLPLAPRRLLRWFLRRAFTLEHLEAGDWEAHRWGSGLVRMAMAPDARSAARFAASRLRRG